MPWDVVKITKIIWYNAFWCFYLMLEMFMNNTLKSFEKLKNEKPKEQKKGMFWFCYEIARQT